MNSDYVPLLTILKRIPYMLEIKYMMNMSSIKHNVPYRRPLYKVYVEGPKISDQILHLCCYIDILYIS